MTPLRLAVAPHFHLARGWERLHRRDGADWRPMGAEEIAPLLLDPTSPREALAGCVTLFVIPSYLRSAFWQMLDEVGIDEGRFADFAAEVARFLAFKEIGAPPGASIELVMSQPGQAADIDLREVWGLIHLGEERAAVVIEGVRIELDMGEGCRLPPGMHGEVWPADEEPGVFVVVR